MSALVAVLVVGFTLVVSGFLLGGAFTLMLIFFCVVFEGAEICDFLASRVDSPSIDLFSFIVYNYNIMTMKITKKQLAVLNFLQDFMDENGYSPSYREIMNGLGLTSVSAVAEHIDNLVAKGVVKKNPGAARSLEVLDYMHKETVELFRARMIGATDEEKRVLLDAAEVLGLDLDADFGAEGNGGSEDESAET